jgi:hypothetical protein
MKLHNLFLNRNVEISNQRLTNHIHEGDEWVGYDNFCDDDVALRGFARGEHRRLMTNKLKHQGLPDLSMLR